MKSKFRSQHFFHSKSGETMKVSKPCKDDEVLRNVSRKSIVKEATFQYKRKNASLMLYSSFALVAKLDGLSLHKKAFKQPDKEATMGNSNSIKVRRNVASRLSAKAQSNESSKNGRGNPVTSISNADVKLFNASSTVMPSFNSIQTRNNPKRTEVPSCERSYKFTKHRTSLRRKNDKAEWKIRIPISKRIHKNSMSCVNASKTTRTKSYISAKSCSHQAHITESDITANELASYLENYLVLPKKMSSMAEMMYT